MYLEEQAALMLVIKRAVAACGVETEKGHGTHSERGEAGNTV